MRRITGLWVGLLLVAVAGCDDRNAPASAPPAAIVTAAVTPAAHRILPAEQIVEKVEAQPWARGGVKQIPATVVDKGVLRYVPYTSYRVGEGEDAYEVNVYGDPAAPACVEAGCYGKLVSDVKAQENCTALIRQVMASPDDASRVKHISVRGDRYTNDGITFETTLPDAEDSYGGWWISVYEERSLERSRATPKEVAEISEPATPAEPEPVATRNTATAAQPTPMRSVAPATPRQWTASDLRYSRPSGGSSSASRSGGSVYVRGYTRKDGTYVRAHARSRPGSGGRR